MPDSFEDMELCKCNRQAAGSWARGSLKLGGYQIGVRLHGTPHTLQLASALMHTYSNQHIECDHGCKQVIVSSNTRKMRSKVPTWYSVTLWKGR